MSILKRELRPGFEFELKTNDNPDKWEEIVINKRCDPFLIREVVKIFEESPNSFRRKGGASPAVMVMASIVSAKPMLPDTFKLSDLNLQCRTVLRRMITGERLTMKSSVNSGIGDIRRRAVDLINFGIPVTRKWASDNHGNKLDYKEYFIEDDDRFSIAQRIIDINA